MTWFAFAVKRAIFRDARALGTTPLDAARSKTDVTSFKEDFTPSASFSERAAVNFLMDVLIAEDTARFLRRRFWACRSLFNADG